MKIEKQVCTLAQAKQLKKLGIEQKAANYFWDESDNQLYRCVDGSAADIGCFAAFTVAEMGRMLGAGTKATEKTYDAVLEQLNKGMSFSIAWSAQFVANCLIGALDHEIVKLEECNQRLSA